SFIFHFLLFMFFFLFFYILFFPTRRSSDLRRVGQIQRQVGHAAVGRRALDQHRQEDHRQRDQHGGADQSLLQSRIHRRLAKRGRSEEHTSELQSRENLVCRLLLLKINSIY